MTKSNKIRQLGRAAASFNKRFKRSIEDDIVASIYKVGENRLTKRVSEDV
ncbi:MAG: hypothetical protein RMJ75_00050 [Nitrososphaerota archaeon]|nr:hypothetical protein [Nitrososphaerota archaeon]